MNREVEKLLPLVQKPARYIGGELNSCIKNKEDVDLRFAFCFPDSYEIGMSHLGMKILYSLINERPDSWCERVFAPWEDMEKVMRERNIPLFALESGDYIKDFDVIGFTLLYEMSYTNVLNMLDLAGLPVRSADRKSLSPLVIAGGPCVCNSEPLSEFIDVFEFGEGEEVMNEFLDLYKEYKEKNASKDEFLVAASKIEGIYVPSLYDVEYNGDNTVKRIVPKSGAPEKIRKRVVSDFDKCYYPDKFIVPYIDVVFDRATAEIFRGCIRGCRFCQAGFIYRPIRERKADTINEQCRALCETSGYDEISLSSLSTSDFSGLEELTDGLLDITEKQKIGLSLPSLRIDNFSLGLMEKVQKVRKSGITFAPEAGTQRLRDVINKNITEENIMKSTSMLFRGGWTNVKLYFMIGLPTETMEDVRGIAELAGRVLDVYFEIPKEERAKNINITVSTSSFVPKPFTAFQWEPQDSREMIIEKQNELKRSIPSKRIRYSWHDNKTSTLEGIFARGDRRLCDVIIRAVEKGCKFDGWSEYFRYDLWMEAFEELGIDTEFYNARKRSYDEILPWDHIDIGITKDFFIRESEKAQRGETTPNCREKCAGCGIARFKAGVCCE